MKGKIAALYIRVSTDMQTELSPDAQKRIMIDYADKNNITVSNEHIYYDDGVSGRKKSLNKRTGFNFMIANAKQKPRPFDIILVHKFSRFARSQEDSIVYKNMLKKQCGINVISISEPIIEGPYGELIERIIEWMDEFYSINLGNEVFKGMSEKALRGGFQARPPLGYRIIHKGEPPVIVPEEAKTVKIIFTKYVDENMSIYDITRYLNSLGLKTSFNKPFEKRSLEYILHNPTYIGMTRWNRTCNDSNKIKDESDWIIAQGQHEAIISNEIYEKAQKRYKAEFVPKNARPSSTLKHWLSGMLKCSNCGRTLSSSSRPRKTGQAYFSFQCYGYLKGKCKVSHSIAMNKIVPIILDGFKHDCGNLDFEKVERRTNPSNEIELLNAMLNKLDNKETRVKEAYINGIDTIDEYKRNKNILQEERADLEKQIHELDKMYNEEVSKAKVYEKLQNVYNILLTDVPHTEKNQALKSIVSKIIYYKPDDSIQIFYYI